MEGIIKSSCFKFQLCASIKKIQIHRVKKLSLISIIVPIYKIERYIGYCIESILRQTYQNLEIILVDDGSPDLCPQICDIYAQKDSRIKVIHKANGGLVSARKAGLSIAKGDYIGYVDGDDWVAPDFCEALVNEAEINKADIVAAGRSRDLFNKIEQFLDNIPIGFYFGEKLNDLRTGLISYGAFYKPGVSTYVWNKLFKRDFIFTLQNSVDERISLGEDGAVTFSALMSCNSLSVIDNCSYHYRQREDSMLKKSTSYEKEAIQLKLLHSHLSAYAQKDASCYNYRQQVDDYILSIYIIRSGAVITATDGRKLCAYNADLENKDIVIYSAGTFGQQLINRFAENAHCNVVGVVDDDYWEYRRCCINVDPVEDIGKFKYDYILIATVDGDVANKAKTRLLNLGVQYHKLLTINLSLEERRDFLKMYLEQTITE